MLKETSDIIAPEEPDALKLYQDKKSFEALISEISAVVEASNADILTAAGRKEIASLSRKIARVKVAVDDAGKNLGEEARNHLKAINDTRAGYRQALQDLQDDTRAPLTEWEQKEAERKAKEERVFAVLKNGALVRVGATASEIEANLETIVSLPLDPDVLGDRLSEATMMRDQCADDIRSALEAQKKAEAERAELERLRKAEAERERQEQAAKAALDQAASAETEAAPAPSPAPATREITREGFDAMTAKAAQAKSESPLDQAAKAICSVVEISADDAKVIVKAICARRVPHLQWKD